MNTTIITINGTDYKVVQNDSTDQMMAQFPNIGAAMVKTNKVARLLVQRLKGASIYEVYEFANGQFGKVLKVA